MVAWKEIHCSGARSDSDPFAAFEMLYFVALAAYLSETNDRAYAPSNHNVDKGILLHPIHSYSVDMSYYSSPPCAFSDAQILMEFSSTESNILTIQFSRSKIETIIKA
jgi:hypothetical protein